MQHEREKTNNSARRHFLRSAAAASIAAPAIVKSAFAQRPAGGGVGHYGYTMHLAESRVLHAGPEKAHSLGGYIRYTKDNVFISETRSLGITVYDKRAKEWVSAGRFGQSMRRDRTNDEL